MLVVKSAELVDTLSKILYRYAEEDELWKKDLCDRYSADLERWERRIALTLHEPPQEILQYPVESSCQMRHFQKFLENRGNTHFEDSGDLYRFVREYFSSSINSQKLTFFGGQSDINMRTYIP